MVEGAWPLALSCATSSGAQLVPFVNATLAQVMAIKLLVRRLLGRAKHRLTLQEAGTLAEPVLRLLTTCLRDYGQLPSEAQGITPYVASLAITCAPSSPFYSRCFRKTRVICPHPSSHAIRSAADQSRLRLAAAKGLLKLAASPAYRRLITPSIFVAVAQMMQDSCVQVRGMFAHKLHVLLSMGRLPAQYAACFVLSAIDPVKERRVEVRRLGGERELLGISRLKQERRRPGATLHPPSFARHFFPAVCHHAARPRRQSPASCTTFWCACPGTADKPPCAISIWLTFLTAPVSAPVSRRTASPVDAGGNNCLPEYTMPSVVHLLAYHPDFARENHAILVTFQQYLEFYFDQLCRGHNESYALLKVCC